MLEKLFAIVAKAALVAPVIINDVDGAVSKIKAAPTAAAKVEDGLQAALEGLEALFGKLE